MVHLLPQFGICCLYEVLVSAIKHLAHRQHPSIREARTLPSLSRVDVTHFRALTFEDMPNLEVSQARSEPQRLSRGSKRGRRRGQCGRSRSEVSSHRSGGDTRTSSSDASRIKPGSTAAPITGSTSASGSGRSGIINPRSRDRRLRGQCQSGRRGGAAHDIPRPSAQRTFGGRLTSVLEHEVGGEPSTLAVSLSGSAPEFVPGRPVSLRVPEILIQSKPKPSKSVADDLGQRIHEDIANLNYECAICTDDISRTSQVWSCTVCWTVVHLMCVKRWYANQKKQQGVHSAEPQIESFWRCPGCNSKLTDEPGSYTCWCGKDLHPPAAAFPLPPHSCGQTCSRPRSTCPHPCSTQCHAGPCPPCDLVGLPQFCFCGKNETRRLCRETDYDNGWSCQEVCADTLSCGEHFCSKPCHTGLCGECDVDVKAKCYCGQTEKLMPCFARQEPRLSYSEVEHCWFEGVFTCDQLCQRSFDCGVHKCSRACHPQQEESVHCPDSADSVTHCPCNKTPLKELLDEPRSSCEDPIPHCEKPCHKKLSCGHLCASKCHTGDCGFCNSTMDIACVCGRTSNKSVCHQGHIQRPVCLRLCQANLNCGRHKCRKHCCSGEKKALVRQAARRKHKTPGETILIEAEHICIKLCGRKLHCGDHECQQICHRGPCASCPEAIFTEISCDCGRTVLQPPQPCGTGPPECRFDCQRLPNCGHPAVEHSCHPGDLSCPKCPFLIEKWCACGKEKLQSQPCHLREARCGKVCGKKLKCGLHYCKKICHRAGECEDATSTGKHCEQLCGKRKLLCEHTCGNVCHGQTLCNETLVCTAKATLTCSCGIRQQQVKCLVSSLNPAPARPDIQCDGECLRLERNRRLAAALNIDPASYQNDHVPYAGLTLKLFEENTSWAEIQEREFRVFAKSPNEARLRFKPMISTHRQFLHNLAEDYGLESKSEDTEPHRYVIVFKGSRFHSAPSKTLAQCAKIRAAQTAEAAASNSAATRASSPMLSRTDPSNGFLLTSPRFGLTIDEVKSTLHPILGMQPSIHFEISFLPSEDVLLRATTSYSTVLSPTALEQSLNIIRTRLAKSIEATGLAGKIILCHVDPSSTHIIRRDDPTKQDASGWSAVAGRGAAKPGSIITPVGNPETKTGRMVGLRKKHVGRDKAWTKRLDGDAEC